MWSTQLTSYHTAIQHYNMPDNQTWMVNRRTQFLDILKAGYNMLYYCTIIVGQRKFLLSDNRRLSSPDPTPSYPAQDMLHRNREGERVSRPSHPRPWNHRPLPHSVIVLSRLQPPARTRPSCSSLGQSLQSQSSFTIIQLDHLLGSN